MAKQEALRSMETFDWNRLIINGFYKDGKEDQKGLLEFPCQFECR
jgi:hypothetical protein